MPDGRVTTELKRVFDLPPDNNVMSRPAGRKSDSLTSAGQAVWGLPEINTLNDVGLPNLPVSSKNRPIYKLMVEVMTLSDLREIQNSGLSRKRNASRNALKINKLREMKKKNKKLPKVS